METVRGLDGSATPVRYAVYDVAQMTSNSQALNVEVKYVDEPDTRRILPPSLTAHRFQTGNIQFSTVCCVKYEFMDNGEMISITSTKLAY